MKFQAYDPVRVNPMNSVSVALRKPVGRVASGRSAREFASRCGDPWHTVRQAPPSPIQSSARKELTPVFLKLRGSVRRGARLAKAMLSGYERRFGGVADRGDEVAVGSELNCASSIPSRVALQSIKLRPAVLRTGTLFSAQVNASAAARLH